MSSGAKLERPGPGLRRLLGDRPVLVVAPQRAQSWAAQGLIPPLLIVERGQEVGSLTSAVAATALRLDTPLIVEFEGGWRQVTAWAGYDLRAGAARQEAVVV